MTYTAENIANIKRNGDLDAYIAHEEQLIASLEAAEIEFGKQGRDSVSYAHLYGRIGIDVDNSAAPHNAVASTSYIDWSGSWSVASFDGDQGRALAYARAALRNQLTRDATALLAASRARLASLQAAR
jgi:hypothetical protein